MHKVQMACRVFGGPRMQAIFNCDLPSVLWHLWHLLPSLDQDATYTTNKIWTLGTMAKRVRIGIRITCIFCLAILSTAVGCGDRSMYIVDPVKASKAAIEQYDKDGDSLLDATELKNLPGPIERTKALRRFER